MIQRVLKQYFAQAYLRGLLIACVFLPLQGCSSVSYYWQAVSGHLDLTSREQPVEALLAEPGLDPELRRKLLLAQRARRFASTELALPDNDSYTAYADLERPYAVWNVIATPALSITPRQWCYVFVGCMSYRGFFAKAEAQAYAASLRAEGYDVYVAGAAAYSTLGYFDDPLLNTMLRRGDTELVGVIFHELAHQVVYVEGDSAFNEAFASSVEQEGLRRWYAQTGNTQAYQEYLIERQQRHAVMSMLQATRQRLDTLFQSDQVNESRLTQKEQIYAQLKQQYQTWRLQHDYEAMDNWFAQDLNNAHLALIATYQALVPDFLAMLDSVDGDLARFYIKVAELSTLSAAERHRTLKSITSVKR